MADLERVRALAERLIAEHLDDSWSFDYDRAKTRAGMCDYARRRITVSRYLTAMEPEEQVRQTLLHELGHALAGPGAGHGPEWRRIAAELGYVGGRTHDGRVASEYARWIGTCPNGHRIYRFRRPGQRAMSCARCSRGFDRRFLIRWSERER